MLWGIATKCNMMWHNVINVTLDGIIYVGLCRVASCYSAHEIGRTCELYVYKFDGLSLMDSKQDFFSYNLSLIFLRLFYL